MDNETKDTVQSTALAVVESQQKIVGGALVGSTGAGVLDQGSQAEFDILEQIRDLQLKTVRGIGEFVKKLDAMLGMEKDAARREKEDANELAKENQGQLTGPASDVGDGADDKDSKDKAKGLSAFTSFLSGLPGVGAIGKLFAPILGFFGKSGILFRTFGKAGPIGAIILGVTLLYKYSDEIAAALTPALDKIKDLMTKLKPVTDFLLKVGDFLIKNLLEGIGSVLEYVIDAVTRVVDGFKMLFDGDILGGLSEIFGGVFDFILAIPKAILETVINILTPLATAVGGFFTQLYDDIVLYVTDVVKGIGDWFVSLKDSIVNFFTTAYENAKEQITKDINGMIDFVKDIFNSVVTKVSDTYNNIKDFLTSLPERIMSSISNMFSPIIDFFAGIGNRIKETINGIIESLPLPDFVKKKMKFDIQPTQSELDSAETGDASIAEKIALDEAAGMETIGGRYKFKDGVLQENGQDFSSFSPDFAQTVAASIGEQVKTAMNVKTGKYVVVKNDLQLGERPGTTTMSGPGDLSDILGSDGVAKNVNISGTSIPTGETGGNAPIIIQKGGDTNTSSVTSKSETYTGPLDTGIDPYHERTAFNYG